MTAQATFADSGFSSVEIDGRKYDLRLQFFDDRSGPANDHPCIGWVNGVLTADDLPKAYDVGGGWVQFDGRVVAYRGWELGHDREELAEALGVETDLVEAALIAACPDSWPEAEDAS